MSNTDNRALPCLSPFSSSASLVCDWSVISECSAVIGQLYLEQDILPGESCSWSRHPEEPGQPLEEDDGDPGWHGVSAGQSVVKHILTDCNFLFFSLTMKDETLLSQYLW